MAHRNPTFTVGLGAASVAIRIRVRDAATSTVLDMELEPDATIGEVLNGAAGYWGKDPGSHVLRKGTTVLRSAQTIIEAQITEGDVLALLTEAEAKRPVLVLEGGEGRSLSVDTTTVLGRLQLQSFFASPQEAIRISSQHMSVLLEAGFIAIEDGAGGQPSRNGTLLNGRDIRGRGRIPIRDGDIIGVAGILRLTVRIVVGG